MQGLLKLTRLVDGLTTFIGRGLIWLILASVLISAGNAIVRKIFDMGSNALLEIQWYLYAMVFMLGSGFAFLKNAHVRIDFISNHFSARTRNLIDIFGIILFLFPLCYMIITLSWPTFHNAWVSGEMSQNAGGLIRWPVYLLIPVGFFVLFLQGLSELIKRAAFITGSGPDSISHVESPEHDTINLEINEHAAHVDEEIR
ncbi:MAG: TRAP transporter small permease subunit [Sulfuritalea sp.]|nr:TRAP transporter small permease subunit [Sulfuritalea sp.]